VADRCLIIAEAGVNHNGSIDTALQLVQAAAQAGADVVKFQTFRADQLATARVAKAAYQLQNTDRAESQLEMLRRLEISEADHYRLTERCRELGIRFMSTAFDIPSLTLLAAFDSPAVKVPSGDITFAPMLLAAARLGKPLIVSTGMSTLSDVEAALGVIAFGLASGGPPQRGRADFEQAYADPARRAALQDKVTLLHCVTEYPAPSEAVNLRAMDTLAAAFKLRVGYSDHTLGTAVAIAAAARGASVIEKHFTLDRDLPGPDHAASLEPNELREMVRAIREIESALGSAAKVPAAVEVANRSIARRSLVAACRIPCGDVLSADMIACKRPGSGISPMDLWSVIGRRATRDYDADDLIEL
jgi:N-acetylneuraminate synthase